MTLASFGNSRRFQVFGVASMLGALLVWLFPHSASAAVSASVTPNSGLGSDGFLAISASGFGTQLNTVHVLECEHGATDSIQCDANTDDPTINATTSGNYTNPAYHYYELPTDLLGISNIICDATHLCDLLVIQDDYNSFSNPHVLIPITFGAGGATTTTESATTTSSTTSTTGSTTTTSTTTEPTTTTSTSTTTTTVPGETTTTTTPVDTTTTTESTTTTSTTTEPTTTTSTSTTTTLPGETTTTTTPVDTTTSSTTTEPTSTTTSTTQPTVTTVPAPTTTTMPGATTTTTMPTTTVHCLPKHRGFPAVCFCIPPQRPHHGYWPKKFCKPVRHGRKITYECACGPNRGGGKVGSQGSGPHGYNATNASYTSQKLPDAGLPPAAPLMAICGFVILVAGTVLRRFVLRIPA